MNPAGRMEPIWFSIFVAASLVIFGAMVVFAVGEGDTTADLVLGQPSFDTNAANNGGISANSMGGPIGVAVDSMGRVYVADNHRVLVFNNLADTTADTVLGQPNFTTNVSNNGGISANSMAAPSGVAVDSVGRVYVVEISNNRVLIFNNLADTTADSVLGQPNFTTNTPNNGGISANSMVSASGVAVDSVGRVYVADAGNNRILIFNNLADTSADLVLGRPNFTTASGGGTGPGASAISMANPSGVAVDSTGRVFVADINFNRVLVFNNLADTTADLVLGQPNFTTPILNNGGISANSMGGPIGIAVDSMGRVYVADNHRVLVFNNLADTTADLVLGQPNFTTDTFNNGGISANSMGYPRGVAVDSTGRVYVADADNARVLVFNSPPAQVLSQTTTTTTTTSTTTTVPPSSGGSSPSTPATSSGKGCIISRLGLPGQILSALRALRDVILCWSSGRIFILAYYGLR